jgi:tripartite ATP-independent transporter DctM subunit
MTIAILFLVLITLVGAPLFTVLAAGGILASFASDLSPDILVVEMNRLASSPNMLSLPLFILAGVIMANGAAAERLIRFFKATFGWLPAGLGIVSIGACAFFTAFSGASGVTILALGGLLYPMLIKEGYRHRYTAGLLTTSGSLGLLFPPSLAIIIFSIVAGISIEDMFLAGIIPGVLLLLLLTLYSFYDCRHFGLPKHTFSINEITASTKACAWDLLMPIAILTGIFGGYVSVTEAAASTAAYVLFIETVIYKEMTLKNNLFALLVECSILFGSLLIILVIALGLTNLLIDAQLPMQLLEFMQDNVDSKLHFLLLLNVFLLIVGAMMDIFSAIIVVVPLLLPLALQYGIHPAHLGVIFLANLEIGYSTPPVGINLFIASQRFNEPVLTLFRACLPFLFVMIIWLLIITYIPELSLWWMDE